MVPKQLSSDLTALSDCRREFNDMAEFTLIYGYDTVTGTDGDDTVYGTGRGTSWPTLNPGDSLTGGAGTDTLVLCTDIAGGKGDGGTFQVDQLATFTGFEVIRFNRDVYGDLFLGSQSLAVIGDGETWYAQQVYLGSGAVTCVGIDVVYSNSASNWNAGNSIDGGFGTFI